MSPQRRRESEGNCITVEVVAPSEASLSQFRKGAKGGDLMCSLGVGVNVGTMVAHGHSNYPKCTHSHTHMRLAKIKIDNGCGENRGGSGGGWRRVNCRLAKGDCAFAVVLS